MMRKKLSILTMIVILLCGCKQDTEYFISNIETSAVEEIEIVEEVIKVYICGAVQYPGVVSLPIGSRVIDALEIAGGMTQEASQFAVNLATIVTDGEKVYIPTIEEATGGYATTTIEDGLINLNTATVTELCSLSGIGESRAEDIIAYREAHGAFLTIEEIKNVSGIKESIYNKIKDDIKVQ